VTDRDDLIAYIRELAVFHGDFVLTSGRHASYYVDLRRVSLDHRAAPLIGRVMTDLIQDIPDIAAVGGLTMGADPIVGAILARAHAYGRADLKGFLVRKEAKSHGTGRQVEGPVEKGVTVAIVDDVATTGGSSLQAVDAIEAMGGTVSVVLAVLDRLEGAAEAFAARGVPFRALLTIRDLGVEPLETALHPQVESLPPLQGP